MSDEKNALKLLGDQIDFNLNLIILLLLFDAQKNIYTKNKIKIRHIYIYMRDMKTNISVKVLYIFRLSWLIQTLRGPLRE